MKEAAYKGLVRPILEYGSSVWDPHTHGFQEELERVQNRAARFVTGNYVFETFVCLFVLRLNVPVNNFSVMSGRSQLFLGLTSTVGS